MRTERQRTDEDSLTSRCTGLRNLGATCYMNTLLQILFAIKPFRAGLFR
jgi:ubiquitin C-terminal hydrolase